MIELHVLSELDWVRSQLVKMPPLEQLKQQGGPRVNNLLPETYAAYCKILHTVYEDFDLRLDERTWKQMGDYDEEYERLASRTISPQKNFNGKRVRWAEAAKILNFSFAPPHIEISIAWPVRYVGPSEDIIDVEIGKRLGELILSATPTRDFYFAFADITYSPNFYHIFLGSIADDLIKIETHFPMIGEPTYLWSTDRSWCLCIDSRATFSLLGGSKDLINSLVNDNVLECFPIDKDDLAY